MGVSANGRKREERMNEDEVERKRSGITQKILIKPKFSWRSRVLAVLAELNIRSFPPILPFTSRVMSYVLGFNEVTDI